MEKNFLQKNIYTLTNEIPKFVQQLDVRIEAKLQQVPKRKNEAHNFREILNNKNFKNSKNKPHKNIFKSSFRFLLFFKKIKI